MTRFSFGSITRNIKRALVIGALLFSSTETFVSAEESNYKMRIHKNFIK